MILAAKGAVAGAGGLPYQWVAVGAAGALATSTSTTLASWTSRTSGFGTSSIDGVASNGGSLYCIVGDAGKIATSPDGITWTLRTSGTAANLRCVAYANGYWVVGDVAGGIRTSPDGITWTFEGTVFSSTSVVCGGVAYGNGIWVAGGSNGEIRTATDPTGTWTARTSAITRISAYDSVYYSNFAGRFYTGAVAGATLQVQTSTDGITWTAGSLPTAIIAARGCSFTSNASIVACCYNYNTTSGQTDIATTTATTWTDRTNAASGDNPSGAVDGTGRMAFTAANTTQYSDNGTTWTAGAAPGFTALGLCHSSGG